MSGRHSKTLLLAAVALLGVLLLARTNWSSNEPHARPDIILITIDSLRADALGVYGYAKPTSPNLDAFAREAVVITDAVAQAPFTKPSIASLMTGLLPGAHKTYSSSKPAASIMKRGGIVKGTFEVTDALPPELSTLADAMTAQGYRTVGFSTNPYLIKDFGYAKGFAEFRFFSNGEHYMRAPEVLKQAVNVLRGSPRQPVFLWVHLMDVHNPYTPAPQYRAMFPVAQPPRIIADGAMDPAIAIENSRDANLYRARYDACIRELDANLGDFFRQLRALNEWGRAAVVVTSDHGEEFLEHGHVGHNTALYDEQVHVPMLLKLPGIRARRLPIIAQVLDLYPTLIHVAGGKPDLRHGLDLIPALRGSWEGDRYAFTELPGQLWAARSRQWKLISGMPGTGKLYNMATDPSERRNVMSTARQDAARMDHLLAAMISTEVRDGARVAQRQVPIDPRVVDQLRALGYLGRQ